MCRSIKTLRRPADPATEEEIRAAALQFVRKVSGFQRPSRANQQAFDRAVAEITASSGRLLDALPEARARGQAAAAASKANGDARRPAPAEAL